MTEHEILQIFKREKALLTGHFLLSSGLHSPHYMQCALVLQKPWIAEKLCGVLSKKVSEKKIDVVIGPALGGVVVSYEMGRALKARSIFVERENGVFTLRRGFGLKKSEKVLVVEDVVTTGKSTREVIEVVERCAAKVAAVASLVDRSGGAAIFHQEFFSLLKMDIKTYRPENCPLCREKKIPLKKPGSRTLIAWIVFILLFCPRPVFSSQEKESSDAALAQAKQDYRVYLEQLKSAGQQYKEVTGEMKKVIQEEGVPVFNEETGEISIEHDVNLSGTENVEQTDKEMIVRLELPGLRKDSIQIKVKGKKTVNITAERPSRKQNVPAEPISRTIQLPAMAQEKGMTASYEDGILQIIFLKESTPEVEIPVA